MNGERQFGGQTQKAVMKWSRLCHLRLLYILRPPNKAEHLLRLRLCIRCVQPAGAQTRNSFSPGCGVRDQCPDDVLLCDKACPHDSGEAVTNLVPVSNLNSPAPARLQIKIRLPRRVSRM